MRPGSGAVPWETHQLLSLATRLVERRWDQSLAALGLTHTAALTLKAIAANTGPVNQERLAGQLRIQAQTLGRVMAGLDRTGLVHRSRNAADQRSLDVQLTTAGRDALNAARRAEQDMLPTPLHRNPALDRELAKIITFLSPAPRTRETPETAQPPGTAEQSGTATNLRPWSGLPGSGN